MPECEIHNMIESLFPPEVITEQTEPRLISEGIYPQERLHVCRAAPKRKQEFAAGRVCARRALAKLGIYEFPILAGAGGEPIWPGGIVGSIAHTDGYCGVAVARKTRIEGIGLDAERVCELDAGASRQICTKEELRWIHTMPADKHAENVILIFSAKECLYKCQYPISRKWLGFQDVVISVDADVGEFKAQLAGHESFGSGACFKGRYALGNGFVFTGLVIKECDKVDLI